MTKENAEKITRIANLTSELENIKFRMSALRDRDTRTTTVRVNLPNVDILMEHMTPEAGQALVDRLNAAIQPIITEQLESLNILMQNLIKK